MRSTFLTPHTQSTSTEMSCCVTFPLVEFVLRMTFSSPTMGMRTLRQLRKAMRCFVSFKKVPMKLSGMGCQKHHWENPGHGRIQDANFMLLHRKSYREIRASKLGHERSAPGIRKHPAKCLFPLKQSVSWNSKGIRRVQ